MKRLTGFIQAKWVSFLLSVLLSLPIALIAATAWVKLLDKDFSLKDAGSAASIIFILIIGWIWFITDHFLKWLKNKGIKTGWRMYLLLLAALIPLIAAIYYGWSNFGGNEIPNTFLFKYEMEITPYPYDQNSWGTICILEIEDDHGKKIQPENNSASAFLLTGDWVLNSEGCQYFSPGTTPGSLKFSLTGTTSEAITIYFRENMESRRAIVSINGERVANVLIHSKLEGSQPESIHIPLGNNALLFWNIIGTAGWAAILIVLSMMFTLLLKIIQLPKLISKLSALVEKHPWMSFVPKQISALSALVEKHPWVNFAPIAIGIAILFWPPGGYTSSDVSYYLSLAKNLFHGNGYVNPDLSPSIYRGPIFPLLISLSYSLFGESFRSAVILERIFWALTILITYILGGQLFNQRVGFFASFFVLSTFVINVAFRLVWTDGPLIFFILALQWMFWEAFSKQRGNKWYLLMGVLMGTAYLLKQTAIFIAPLPLLIWIVFSEYRTRRTLLKLFIFYMVFALFYFGWMGYVYLAGGSPNQVASDFNIVLSIFSRLTSLLNIGQNSFTQTVSPKNYAMSLPQILATFYNRDIVRYFRIAPFFLVAVIYTAFQAFFKKSKPDFHLGMGLLLFSSMIPIQVIANFGFRQNLYFYIIGMICIVAMIERLFNKVGSKIASSALVLAISAALVFIQISGNNAVRKPTTITNQETLNYFSDYQKVATWVENNIKPDEKILISEREGDILHILTTGNRTFEIINDCRGEWATWPAVACAPPYILFWINKGTTDPNNPRDILLGLSEPSILSTINDKNVSYVIVTPRIYSLYYYLKVHPDFEELAVVGNFAIFRVNRPVQPISAYPHIRFETCLGVGTPEYLKNLEESNPMRFEARLRDEFGPWMGLTEQDMKAFQNWQGCQFEATFPGEYRSP
ncbi:MAG: hypothetical protein A2X25_06280 [Chloroflexi bacterium GWB2_49_20]|nr:MAG: hypothetical protein A2X25_06280 [Chloroflexi bacterium GWB2_49_20]OGN80348.1 MAG: hypothetical protein A2X26_08500 [Chloroflexi bacterium GWC2_49_37]OGN85812.1 MAG: hypothetical protein A2X27_03320 [Chloroflexi bacterium GWD2_49_16]HCC79308.1 hypothetical protein [Anaerolineae bacterium]HCM96472.1 hypothetical protein [Anaerolineae bacterium]